MTGQFVKSNVVTKITADNASAPQVFLSSWCLHDHDEDLVTNQM